MTSKQVVQMAINSITKGKNVEPGPFRECAFINNKVKLYFWVDGDLWLRINKDDLYRIYFSSSKLLIFHHLALIVSLLNYDLFKTWIAFSKTNNHSGTMVQKINREMIND